MKKNPFLAFLLLSLTVFSQNKFDQYSIEADYGLSHSANPSITEFSHFGAGFRYMFNEYWGVKFDYAQDKFRTDDTPELGADYNRYSVQGVHNLGRTLNLSRALGGSINLLAHGGLGYSSLQSIARPGVDKIGNVIIGVTPQVKITNFLALTLDTSFILNFTQHLEFDGTYPEGTGAKEAFTGKMFTASLGLTFYFGRNGSDSDWR